LSHGGIDVDAPAASAERWTASASSTYEKSCPVIGVPAPTSPIMIIESPTRTSAWPGDEYVWVAPNVRIRNSTRRGASRTDKKGTTF